MIGILSDAHGNFRAFDLAVRVLELVNADKLIFLGDAIGYLPTLSIIALIQDLGKDIKCIIGNHEHLIILKSFNKNIDNVYQHKRIFNQMSSSQLDYISNWPKSLSFSFPCGDALFVHGSPNDFTYDYVYKNTDLNRFSVSQDFVFMGHTHHPFIISHSETTYINVGSCGLPRDNGSYGAVALFDEQTGEVQIIRFNIQHETNKCLKSFEYIHPSVKDIFKRHSEMIEGKIVDE